MYQELIKASQTTLCVFILTLGLTVFLSGLGICLLRLPRTHALFNLTSYTGRLLCQILVACPLALRAMIVLVVGSCCQLDGSWFTINLLISCVLIPDIIWHGYLTIEQAIADTSELAFSLGASRPQVWRKFILPEIWNPMLQRYEQVGVHALSFVLLAEYITEQGLGHILATCTQNPEHWLSLLMSLMLIGCFFFGTHLIHHACRYQH